MTLWAGTVTLPALPDRGLKIAGNLVVQRVFAGAARVAAKVVEASGHHCLVVDLPAPFNELRLHSKALGEGVPGGATAWPAHVDLSWSQIDGFDSAFLTPDAVLDSWKGRFQFRAAASSQGSGLRPPQMGALHAICAHFAVGATFDPATVVLPTGTGKTETMLATLVSQRLKKVLVLVPSDALRSQVSRKFISLGILADAGLIPQGLPGPRVAMIRRGLKSAEEAQQLVAEANVIVALPQGLQACDPGALDVLVSECSDLIVDEAHHVAARTWKGVRERFTNKRIIQFTATPFRRDGLRVDGKIIFNYKLGDAQQAGYYTPISLVDVEEYGETHLRDRAIAKLAIGVLRKDRAQGFDHLLMARTSSRNRADAVAAIYQEVAPELNPVTVHSGPGRQRSNQEALSRLLDRGDSGARIVVCVDMLGEGFDLPNLKVAAIHDVHKSLAITLQFVGRFTRGATTLKLGDASVVVNLADPATEDRLAELYAEGADWDQIIRRLSEQRIGDELKLQDVVLGLRESGSLSKQLSLWNLRPAFSVQYFQAPNSTWSPLKYREALPASAEAWHALSQSDNVLIAVVRHHAAVKWGKYQEIGDTIYDLLILKWDTTNHVLCLFASDSDALRSAQIAQAVTSGAAQLVCGDRVFNALNNVELPLAKSLGSSRVGAISFTSYFGPNVTEGLASIEKAESELNNIACLGYEGGDRVLWGAAKRKGKIWQQRGGSIAEWLAWTASTWSKVQSSLGDATNVTRDFLRPVRLSHHHDSFPILAQWGEQAQTRLSERQAVIFGDTEVPLYEVDLSIADVEPERAIQIRIACEQTASTYRFRIAEDLPGGYSYQHLTGHPLRFKTSSHVVAPIEQYLQVDPFIIGYADGTHSYNCYHIARRLDSDLLPRDRLEGWDWGGIPLNNESMHKAGDQNSIQYRTFVHLRDEFDVIVNDDGCGEAADLVCLKHLDEANIRLCLVHCKGAHEGRVSGDIRNFYVVCGQAQKSAAVKHAGLGRLCQDLRRRNEAWVRDGYSRLLKGSVKDLVRLREMSRKARVDLDVVLVQPGTSAATISADGLRLLGTTELYLLKTAKASLRVVVSS